MWAKLIKKPIKPCILPFVSKDINPKIVAGILNKRKTQPKPISSQGNKANTEKISDKFPKRALSLSEVSSFETIISGLISETGNEANELLTNKKRKKVKNVFLVINLSNINLK